MRTSDTEVTIICQEAGMPMPMTLLMMAQSMVQSHRRMLNKGGEARHRLVAQEPAHLQPVDDAVAGHQQVGKDERDGKTDDLP
jgi:hypothetical protein